MTFAFVTQRAVRLCPLCGGESVTALTRLRYALFDDCPLSPSFAWVFCNTCGFPYYDTPSTSVAFDAYYRDNTYYWSAMTVGAGGSSPAERKRFEATAAIIAKYLSAFDQCIFDVGCGKGGLLSALRLQGFTRLHAIDMLLACIDYVRRNLGFPAQCGSAERLPFDGITPDLLIYSHVLEHVLHPRAVLEEAWNRLAEGGLVYVEVPDAARYGEFSYLPYAELYLEHINHFDVAHLKMLMTSCGFQTIDTSSIVIEVDGAASAPCIYGVFRKVTQRVKGTSFVPSVVGHLTGYVTKCQSSALHGRLEEIAAASIPLYVWGISQYAQLLLGQTALGRCAIKALVDRDIYKQTKSICGKPILAPERLKDAQPQDAVVLTGFNYRESMRYFLQKIGFPGHEIILE